MSKISILIADDHLLVREGFGMLLNSNPRFHVIADCASGEEALELGRQLRPNVVLMDINMPGLNCFESTQLIRKFSPGSRILCVSMHTQLCYVRKLLRLGALGYVTKSSPSSELFEAIIEVNNSRKYLCEEIRNIQSMQLLAKDEQKSLNFLSFREMEIIEHIKLGYSSKEIAGMLNLAKKTVEIHRHNILKKLNIKNSAALVNHINGIA